ncbi:MAG: hypothetical protein HUU55_17685 [Myxococcales bacterium]|nr:hypothetical protein [Myxococcales bacterium]
MSLHQMIISRFLVLIFSLHIASCDDSVGNAGIDDVNSSPVAIFPANFMSMYSELRDCRHSHEHELNHIRVFANDLAAASYLALSPDVPYPPGSILVKAEYEDKDCLDLIGFTAVRRGEVGSVPDVYDWYWQKLDADRNVTEDGAPWRCINCHAVHCAPPHGFELTCAEEI